MAQIITSHIHPKVISSFTPTEMINTNILGVLLCSTGDVREFSVSTNDVTTNGAVEVTITVAVSSTRWHEAMSQALSDDGEA